MTIVTFYDNQVWFLIRTDTWPNLDDPFATDFEIYASFDGPPARFMVIKRDASVDRTSGKDSQIVDRFFPAEFPQSPHSEFGQKTALPS